MTETLMLREASETPAICAAQIRQNRELVRDAANYLRRRSPPFVATLARGSSGQAAMFGKVLLETRLQLPTLAHAPSIGSVYGTTSPLFRGVPVLAVSQSGRSPDLLAAAEGAKGHGAVIVAVVNDEDSPLAGLADIVIPVRAGVEASVAATKSFVATLTAISHLIAEWGGDEQLRAGLESIGDTLAASWSIDWTVVVPNLREARSLLVLGRGLTLPIAGEAALKLKETSGLHAEAFSSAEVAHGPMTLIRAGDPVLVFGPLDAARGGLANLLGDFARRGAVVIGTGHPADLPDAALRLAAHPVAEPAIGAIAAIQSFYRLANALSLARGHDPDSPPHLAKVTKTL
jgi:glucosamine--fructose-6-phosphate aminotransferase (isomerizing)